LILDNCWLTLCSSSCASRGFTLCAVSLGSLSTCVGAVASVFFALVTSPAHALHNSDHLPYTQLGLSNVTRCASAQLRPRLRCLQINPLQHARWVRRDPHLHDLINASLSYQPSRNILGSETLARGRPCSSIYTTLNTTESVGHNLSCVYITVTSTLTRLLLAPSDLHQSRNM
jgi:hypothetical protein